MDRSGGLAVVESRCRDGDWAGVVDERARRRAEGDPAAALATYRLALEAPVGWLAAALDGGDDGDDGWGWKGWPVIEVAASRLGWAEAAGHLPARVAGPFADERVVRGEDLLLLGPGADALPRSLSPWEPGYPLASYTAHGASFPPPHRPARAPKSLRLPRPGEPIGDPYTVEAVRDLAASWTDVSDARGRMVVTEGRPSGALAALVGGGSASLVELTTVEALAWLGWVGAAGGPRRPRRGAAAGRVATWRLLAALGGLTEEWPVPPGRLAAVGAGLRWWAWEAEAALPGPGVRLVTEDAAEELSWAVELVRPSMF